MANIALIKDGIVQNIVVVESLQFAQNIFSDTCVEYAEDHNVTIGASYDATTNTFKQPSPFPSWVWDDELNTWQAPVPKPVVDQDPYDWDEETKSWVPSELPTEEPPAPTE